MWCTLGLNYNHQCLVYLWRWGWEELEKAADGFKGGMRGHVSLEPLSWALGPLRVGSRAGWQVPSAGWVMQEAIPLFPPCLQLACLCNTAQIGLYFFFSSVGNNSITFSCWAELFPKEVRGEISLAWPEAISWGVNDISGGVVCIAWVCLGRTLGHLASPWSGGKESLEHRAGMGWAPTHASLFLSHKLLLTRLAGSPSIALDLAAVECQVLRLIRRPYSTAGRGAVASFLKQGESRR